MILTLVIVGGALWFGLRPDDEGDRPATPTLATSFAEHGLAFEIPPGLRLWEDPEDADLQLADLPAGVRSPLSGAWYEVLTLDPSNILVIYPDELGFVVDESNLDTYADVLSSVSGEIAGEDLAVEPGAVAGFPSIAVEAHEVETPLGTTATNEVVEVFDGNLGYAFLCQSTEGTRMHELCQQVLDDVSIEPDRGRAAWTTLDSGGGHRIDVPPGWTETSPVTLELIHAVFSSPGGDVPIAELQFFVEPIIGDDPPPRRFVIDIVGRLRGSEFELQDRDPISLPQGSAEKVVFRAGPTRLAIVALVHGTQGIQVAVLTYSDQETADLLAPTVEAVARSLVIED